MNANEKLAESIVGRLRALSAWLLELAAGAAAGTMLEEALREKAVELDAVTNDVRDRLFDQGSELTDLHNQLADVATRHSDVVGVLQRVREVAAQWERGGDSVRSAVSRELREALNE